MTAAQFFTVFSTAMIMVLFCKADSLPEPSSLTYKWVDPFSVNLTWEEPRPRKPNTSSTFKFLVKMVDEGQQRVKCQPEESGKQSTPFHNASFKCLLTEGHNGGWKASVQCVSECDNTSDSNPVEKDVFTPKTAVPRAELVKDFKCLIKSAEKSSCSWIPANLSANLNVSYRFCNDVKNGLQVCDQHHSEGGTNVCYLNLTVSALSGDVCMCVQNDTAMSTFLIDFEISVPKMTIKESAGYLNLEWEPPKIGAIEVWKYNVHYKECNKQMDLHIERPTMWILHNKSCSYEFEYNVTTTKYNKHLTSRNGTAFYGVRAFPDETMTIVAIAVPIILSVCVILSCFCFRRHMNIICPVLPDPSQIFKDFMNGKKELKIPVNVCEPEKETFVDCVISPVSEDSVLQQSF